MELLQVGAMDSMVAPTPSVSPTTTSSAAPIPPVQTDSSGVAASSALAAGYAPTLQQVQAAVDKSNQALAAKSVNELEFTVAKSTGMFVIKLVDRQSGSVLMQIPSLQMLAIAQSIDQAIGAIVQQKA